MDGRTARAQDSNPRSGPDKRRLVLCYADTRDAETVYEEVGSFGLVSFYRSLPEDRRYLMIVEMLTRILKSLRDERDKTYSRTDLTGEVVSFISTYYTSKTVKKDLLEHFRCSTRQLSMLTKEATGFTVTGLIRHLRLGDAHDRLISSTLPVYEIADRVGYGNETVLIRFYKKTYGITPGDERRKLRMRRL